MKLKHTLLAALMGLLVSGSAIAVPVTYTDTNFDGFIFSVFTPTYSNTFNIVSPAGFNPATETVTSAVATFTFLDAAFNETFTVDVGLDQVLNQTNLSNFSFTTLSGGLGSLSLSDLNADGIVSYTINRTSGAFSLVSSNLVATVPDAGATVALLGLGLLGLAAMRRKLAA